MTVMSYCWAHYITLHNEGKMVEIIGGNVIQNAAFGNEAFAVPFVGIETATAGFGGAHPPIFIVTNFPVLAATVSFEREFTEGDAEVFYTFRDERSAARIRVRQPIEEGLNGFFVDFGQEVGFNEPFTLRFNWMAVGQKE